MLDPSTCAALAAIFLLGLLCYTTWRRSAPSNCPHYPHTDPIFGSDFQKKTQAATAQGQRQAWFRSNFHSLGRTFEVKQWGKRIIHTCDPANAQFILSTQFVRFGLGPSRAPSRPWLGEGIFTMDGEVWRKARELVKPIFLKEQIADLARLERHLARLFGELDRAGPVVELQALFLRMHLDYSIDLLFGDDVNTISGESAKIDADVFIDACDQSLLQVVRSQTPWPLRWYYGWTKTWNQPFHLSQAFVDRHVDTALQTAQNKVPNTETSSPAFIDQLVQHTRSPDRLYLRNQMLNIFFPARDAAGIAISLILFFLARNPTVYTRVRTEVLQHTGGGSKSVDTLTYNAVKRLTYTNAVVNETLRLYGPTGHMHRDVLADTTLPHGTGADGLQPLFVRKGSAVVIHMHAIQRDAAAWGPDANTFRPERWLEASTAAQRRAWEYLPFSGGPRVCPGQAMMLAQLGYIVARFALTYSEIRNVDVEQELVEEHRILMKIRNGVQIRLVE